MIDIKKINEDLQKALKERDQFRLDVLRMMKSKILYVNARGDLPEVEIIKILNKYAKDLKESIEEFKKVNRPDAVEKTEKELYIVQDYLPKELSDEKIKAMALKIKEELGVTSIKEMGKMMKEILARSPGIDGARVKNVVTSILGS